MDITMQDIEVFEKVLKACAKSQTFTFDEKDMLEVISRTSNPLRWAMGAKLLDLPHMLMESTHRILPEFSFGDTVLYHDVKAVVRWLPSYPTFTYGIGISDQRIDAEAWQLRPARY